MKGKRAPLTLWSLAVSPDGTYDFRREHFEANFYPHKTRRVKGEHGTPVSIKTDDPRYTAPQFGVMFASPRRSMHDARTVRNLSEHLYKTVIRVNERTGAYTAYTLTRQQSTKVDAVYDTLQCALERRFDADLEDRKQRVAAALAEQHAIEQMRDMVDPHTHTRRPVVKTV